MTTEVINSTHISLFVISLRHIAAFFPLPKRVCRTSIISVGKWVQIGVCLSMLSSGFVDVASESVNKVLVSGGGKFAHQ